MISIILFFVILVVGVVLAVESENDIILCFMVFACIALTIVFCATAPDNYKHEVQKLDPISEGVYVVEQNDNYIFSFADKNKNIPYFNCVDIHTVNSETDPYVSYEIQKGKMLKWSYRFEDVSCADLYVPEDSIVYI